MAKVNYPKDDANVHHLPCVKCGVMLKRRIDPIALRTYKAYCGDCKRYLELHPVERESVSDNEIVQLAKYMHIRQPDDVKVYKPGDPGFAELAAQYDMKPKPETVYYDAFSHKPNRR